MRLTLHQVRKQYRGGGLQQPLQSTAHAPTFPPRLTLLYLESSPHDPVSGRTVVVGVMLPSSDQWTRAASAIHHLKELVPAAYRKGFFFRADHVLDNARYDELWPRAQRQQLLDELLCLPRRLGLPMIWALLPRTTHLPPQVTVKAHVWDLQRAVAGCLGCAGVLAHQGVVAPDAKIVAHTRSATWHLVQKSLGAALAPTALSVFEQDARLVGESLQVLREDREAAARLLAGLDRRLHFALRTPAWMLQICDALVYAISRLPEAAPESRRHAQLIWGDEGERYCPSPAEIVVGVQVRRDAGPAAG